MRILTFSALAALSLNSYAVEYTPDTDVDYDIIHMHDTTTWAKVCESFDGVCDVPNGTYQVKLLDRNWNELDLLRDVSVRDSGSNDGGSTDGGSTDGGTTGGGITGDTLAELDCGSGDIAKYTAGTWGCAEDIDTDTDTLAGLDCDAGQVAVYGSNGWSCGSPATANAGDIVDAVESMFCIGEGEELTRSGSGALVCEVPVAPIDWGTCPCVQQGAAWTQFSPPLSLSTPQGSLPGVMFGISGVGWAYELDNGTQFVALYRQGDPNTPFICGANLEEEHTYSEHELHDLGGALADCFDGLEALNPTSAP